MKKQLVSLIFIFISLFFQSCEDKDISSFSLLNNPDTTLIIKYDDTNIHSSDKDIEDAQKTDNTYKLGKIYFGIGGYYLNKNKTDSSFYYFNHSKEIFSLLKDYSFVGKNLLNMSIVQANEGDYYGSEETAAEALRFFKSPKDNENIASVYNTLAICKTEQKNYPEAIEYYQKSLEFPKNKFLDLNIKNNQAVVYIKAKNYPLAIKTLAGIAKDSILQDSTSIQYINLKSRIKDNLAYARWLDNPNYNAEYELYNALLIREKINNLPGQIASHSHLSEYFTKNNVSKAIEHAKRMYSIATNTGTPDDRLEALQKLIQLENPEQTKKYFTTYLHLKDSLQIVRNRAKNQFALIRYEVEKNKEENLRLKAENAQKNYLLLRQRVIVFSVTGLTVLGLILFVVWFKRRQERFKREKTEEVHRTELKYSKKIHDEVANGIYSLMVQLENNSSLNKEQVTDNLEELYNRSRNISHESELKTDMKNDFASLLRDMIQPYGAKDTRIIIVGNDSQLWIKLPINKREELYYVLIELMTNMKKHSKASLVTLKFKRENNKIFIDYFDNGTGFAVNNIKQGKGLKNIENRINSIQGKIQFNAENKKGISIKITLTT